MRLMPSVLGAFQNLQWLNIGGTKVDSVYLEELVKYLPRLKYLDISETKVNNITPLKVLKENLNGLIIHCLPLENDIDFEMTLSVLLELKELRVLDVSHYETAASSRFNEIDLFIHSHFAPQIRQLDISGNPFRLTIRDVMEFMKNHSNLRCLGLVLEGWDATELCAQFPNVDIFGGMGEEQIRKTIKRCLDRPCYLTSAFNNISNELNEEDVEEEYFTSDLLELVVRTLENLECLEECSAEGLKSITYLISNLKLENIAHELLNRLTTLLFLAAEKWDNEIVSFWCHEIFLEIKEDRRITFDYKRYCNILFLNLDRFRDAFTKFGAVQLLLNHCFPGMTEADLNEVGVTPTYMKCLIKNAAEIYLEESEVLELIVEGGDERLHYLRDFCKYEHTDNSTINCIFQPYIFAIIKKLIAENLGACRLAIEFGGIEVMTQILQQLRLQVRANKSDNSSGAEYQELTRPKCIEQTTMRIKASRRDGEQRRRGGSVGIEIYFGNRLLNLTFPVTSDDEKGPYWCQEIRICLENDRTVIANTNKQTNKLSLYFITFRLLYILPAAINI
ncbi:unnamed protein product [Hymenolepis diminuta]|uniref:Uncharacterized protein n=1 Tax=Hymenolepis diminuta TaxID=6216 RepID=A0A564Z3N0_HYMDI|nr:unnamed protein product [Hymenolepis diminuta]